MRYMKEILRKNKTWVLAYLGLEKAVRRTYCGAVKENRLLL